MDQRQCWLAICKVKPPQYVIRTSVGGRPENLLTGNLVTFLYITITCQTKYATPLQRGICNTCQTTSQDLRHSRVFTKTKTPREITPRGKLKKRRTEIRTYENYRTIFSFVSTNLSITSTKSIKQMSWSLVSMTSKFCVNNLTS